VISHTIYRMFNTSRRRECVQIIDDVAGTVRGAGISEGTIVCAMPITAGAWFNDDELGLHEDVIERLDKIAAPNWKVPEGEVAGELTADPGFDGGRPKGLASKVLGE
jgi:thiamine phosphate synthase YjbQ (UPF0047 family)